MCSVDGCDRKHEGRGLCAFHYNRWRHPPVPREVTAKRRSRALKEWRSRTLKERAIKERAILAVDRSTLGGIIRDERQSRGWWSPDLAAKVGCNRETIGHWERNLGLPPVPYIPRLLSALEIPWDDVAHFFEPEGLSDFGRWLHLELCRVGLRQGQLAWLIREPDRRIYQWKLGYVQINEAEVTAIATVLNVDAEDAVARFAQERYRRPYYRKGSAEERQAWANDYLEEYQHGRGVQQRLSVRWGVDYAEVEKRLRAAERFGLLPEHRLQPGYASLDTRKAWAAVFWEEYAAERAWTKRLATRWDVTPKVARKRVAALTQQGFLPAARPRVLEHRLVASGGVFTAHCRRCTWSMASEDAEVVGRAALEHIVA